MPSMVTTFLSPTSPTVSWQERTALPATCTVQTPHWATPQPYLVPTRLRWSRSTHNSGMSSGTSTSRDCPFTVRVSIGYPRGAFVESLLQLTGLNARPVAPVPYTLATLTIREFCNLRPVSPAPAVRAAVAFG